MLIVIAALSLLGATASLLVPGTFSSRRCSSEPLCSRSPGGFGGLEDRSVRKHDPPMNPKGWRDRS